MIQSITIMIAIFILAGPIVHAQTLDSLLREIIEEDPGVQANRLQYQADLSQAQQVGYLPDPQVNLGGFVSPVETRVGPQRFRAGVSQLFPWKGTLDARRDVALNKAEITRHQIQQRKLDVVYRGKMAYYDLYSMEERIQLEQENHRMFEVLESIALAKVESGEGSLADVLRVQLKLAETEERIRELENRKQSPLAVLNALRDMPDTTDFIPKDSLGLAEIGKDTLRQSESDLMDHPALQSLQARRDLAAQRMKLNDLDRKPEWGIGLDYIVVGERDVAELPDNGKDILMPRVMVKLPFYSKKYDAIDQEQQLRVEVATLREKETRRAIEAEIRQAITDYREAELRYFFAVRQKEKTRSALEILTANYSSEGTGFDELLELQLDLIAYDMETLMARVDSHRALAKVDHFLTTELTSYE